MSTNTLVQIILFAPLAAFAVLGIFYGFRHSGKPAGALVCAATFAALLASIQLLAWQWAEPGATHLFEVDWMVVNGKSIASVGWLVDGISVPMLFVVCLVAFCVQLYSFGYLGHEPRNDIGRYYAWHALFVFSMQSLVIAPNLLQLFIGWELVGLCSYLLIGYYWRTAEAGKASLKAFWVNKLADCSFLLGLIVLVSATGSFSWDLPSDPHLEGLVTLVGFLLFVGAMGKAAQAPLHIWLPDAMAGPTPVSALLHAATMVAAGVFLVVRGFPLFSASGPVLMFMCYLGAFTAFMAGCLALIQDDIKKMLAFSTCSQLGYMMAALGAGAISAGYFHLTTHAFFKALLFLTAGSLIHAVHSNKMSEMGGLRKSMPLTFVLYTIGAGALMGFPFITSGFFSKDLVLEALHHQGEWVPFILCMAGAFITALYMTRSILKVFYGEPVEGHESGPAMMIPMLILGVLAVGVGYGVGDFLTMIGEKPVTAGEMISHFVGVPAAGAGLMLLGVAVAFAMHRGVSIPTSRPLADWLLSRPVDTLYENVWRHMLLALAKVVAWLDRYVIDALMNFAAWVTLESADGSRRIQTGRAPDYVWAIAMGALLLGVFGIYGGF